MSATMSQGACPSCGATIEPGAAFCAECGQRLSEPLTRPAETAQAGDVSHGPAPAEAPTAEYTRPPPHAPAPPAAPGAYGPPAPPPPPPPYGTVVYQSPPPPSGHNAATYVALGVASVIAVAAVAVAIVLASSGGGGEPQPIGAAQVATTPPTVTIVREPPARTRTSTGRSSASSGGFVAPTTPRSTRRSSTSSPRLSASAAAEAENAVERHWRLIESGNYAAAYDLLAPGTQSRGPWIAEHVKDALSDVDLNVDATVNSSTSATVRVLHLRTVANSGCNEWTGFYDMAKISGTWRIQKAKISNTPC